MTLKVNIKKQLNAFLLNVNFTVENGTFAILGASGCGKSMTLKCIAGVEKPDSGHIELDGKVFFDSDKRIDLPPQKRHAGYLFQNYALFPNMTVWENIAFVIEGNKEYKDELTQENIVRFHLRGLENDYPCSLSGGQQQRVAFARILAAQSKLLMLDEPFSALDSYLKWQLELELGELLDKYNKTTLFVSHNRDEVYRLCSRIAVMNNGEIEAISDKHGIFEDPQTLTAAILTGCKNNSRAHKVNAHSLYAEDWQLQLSVNQQIPDDLSYVGFRAHFFEPKSTQQQVMNCFRAQVLKVIEDTFSYIIMVRPYGTEGRPLRWELDKAEWLRLREKPLFLTIPENKLILLKK
ncbi:sulfate/molybdate ABC transporter ATP-binding protein [Pectinatus cerevisiiphilus]|uniref:Molybdate transport system ATP-binding protein n=1 Tax=Pectinatus cerevisiiphilus TaxID=86956 RepID=A0A4R3K705_9FIRM|nr:ATP-binding cassette domain-containing protein [Pectinatus cerevisiiphilus]TCS78714.1 molybdate transport system ATP-binding protein [Pectinatus cerevisiiphilus]